MKSSGEVGEVDSGELSFPSFGGDSSAFQVEVSLDDKESDLAVNAFVDLVYVRAGRAVSFLFFGSAFSPFEQDLKEELVGAVAARMGWDAATALAEAEQAPPPPEEAPPPLEAPGPAPAPAPEDPPAEPSQAEIVIRKAGFGQSDQNVGWGLILRNGSETDDAIGVTVTVSAVSRDGNILETDSLRTNVIPAGEIYYAGGEMFVEPDDTVADLEVFVDIDESAPVEFALPQVRRVEAIESDFFGWSSQTPRQLQPDRRRTRPAALSQCQRLEACAQLGASARSPRRPRCRGRNRRRKPTEGGGGAARIESLCGGLFSRSAARV